ncbi:pyridoxal phosphate-dependent aminotransferase [Candidatus Spongiisocius sp.]|uniref:pyridoxal phosphate-dependent aminotransferase n=1 Tax=Candidatus Spongiisocius sp. TaxID=3101273 RepID=UPI003B5AD8AF
MSQSTLRQRLAERTLRIRGGHESPYFQIMRRVEGRDDIIRLVRGEPDIPTPRHIIEAAKRCLDTGHVGYTPPGGMIELREAIARKFKEDNNLEYDAASEVLVTAGAQESMAVSLQTLLDPGDEVLLATPHYMAYPANIIMAGGHIVYVDTVEEEDFELKPEAIEAAITDRTKLLVLVTPNNPTAGVITAETLSAIADVVRAHPDLVVISDELYEKVVYDGFEHVSFATLPDMWDRTITINGFSKAYSMTGFRVGYMAGPADYILAATEPRHSLSISTSLPSQHGALAALEGPQDFMAEMMEEYHIRRAMMRETFDELGVTYGEPKGGFYFFANISGSGMDAVDFADKAVDHGILFSPGNVFAEGARKYIRISYLAPRDQLAEALERFGRLWNDCRNGR